MLRLAITTLTCLLATTVASAAEGDFDPTFGSSGKAVINFDLPNGPKTDGALATFVLNPNDATALRYLSVGYAYDATGPGPQLALAAFRGDGTPDTTFFGGTSAKLTRKTALRDIRKALLVNGKIVVLGMYRNANSVDFGVQRFNLDGSSDLSFGFWSLALANFDLGGANNDFPFDFTADPSGNLYVVGAVDRTGGDVDFGIAKFQPNGTLDPWFAGVAPGRVVVPFNLGADKADVARAVALFGANSIAVAGQAAASPLGTARTDGAMVLLNRTSGAIDTSFCTYGASSCPDSETYDHGKRTFGLTGKGLSARITALVTDPYGIYVIGDANAPTSADPYGTEGFVTHVFASGSLDASFGNDNYARRIKLYDRNKLAAGVLFNGRITVAGTSTDAATGSSVGLIYRLNQNGGTPDNTFATFLFNTSGPMQIVDTAGSSSNPTPQTQLNAITIHATRVIASGRYRWNDSDTDFLAVRLKGFAQ